MFTLVAIQHTTTFWKRLFSSLGFYSPEEGNNGSRNVVVCYAVTVGEKMPITISARTRVKNVYNVCNSILKGLCRNVCPLSTAGVENHPMSAVGNGAFSVFFAAKDHIYRQRAHTLCRHDKGPA
jgi:hypothetical protein